MTYYLVFTTMTKSSNSKRSSKDSHFGLLSVYSIDLFVFKTCKAQSCDTSQQHYLRNCQFRILHWWCRTSTQLEFNNFKDRCVLTRPSSNRQCFGSKQTDWLCEFGTSGNLLRCESEIKGTWKRLPGRLLHRKNSFSMMGFGIMCNKTVSYGV